MADTHSMKKPMFFPLALLIIFIIGITANANPSLTLDYYLSSCPNAADIVRKEMECIVQSEPRMAASILRLHFHDCFVQGCDGSVLLDETITLQGEKKAAPNKNSLRGFDAIDRIKNKLESECPGIVSCADLLTIAARDAVILAGGPYWHVPLGRKDAVTASYTRASTNIPTSDQNLVPLMAKFMFHGLSVTDMVALVGAHTIGLARCRNFRERIYGDFEGTIDQSNPISQNYLTTLKSGCSAVTTGRDDDNTTAMDNVTPYVFDNSFYQILLRGEGLLNSDQEMYSSLFGIQTKQIVRKYAEDGIAFFNQFSDSMVKMGNIINPDTYETGEVRKNCRFVNT
ncbi:hypothetical protein MKW94_020653 [Papaver nudicaule]|uniref:Peroxidase n=1 Tax=Papaver nudicaule TaxID=74823 RepID=A0AA41VJN1_PAPNU|nr:hypothetical protein [Papaver nudicaule]